MDKIQKLDQNNDLAMYEDAFNHKDFAACRMLSAKHPNDTCYQIHKQFEGR
jgi:hypothetical protein